MVITDVGVDIDGVLYDFVSSFKEYCEEQVGHPLPEATKWDFYHEWGLSDEIFQLWLKDASEKDHVFWRGAPLPNAVEGWNRLVEIGVNIHILTHRPHYAQRDTTTWLHKHGFHTNNLHFGTEKNILTKLASGKTAAIDDQFMYYEKYRKAGVLAFLMTQPWNQKDKVTQESDRVTDLLDFAEKVNVYNRYMEIYAKTETMTPPRSYLSQMQFPPYSPSTKDKEHINIKKTNDDLYRYPRHYNLNQYPGSNNGN